MATFSSFGSIRKGLALTTIALSMAWGIGVSSTACSSDAVDTKKDAAAAQDCPVTVAAASGKACTLPGLVCTIGYPCGQFLSETARCTCTDGKFDCVDSKDQAIANPESPKCTSPGGGNSDCPTDQAAADGKSCKLAGQQCAYAGFKCAGNTANNTDICFCTGGTPEGDAAVPLLYRCEIKGCTPPSDGSVKVDTGTPPVDAGPG
jgi:hypothetical protein